MDASKPKKAFPVITTKLLLVAIAFLISVFLFAAIAHEAVLEREAEFDQRVANYLNTVVGNRMIASMRFITFFGSTRFLLPAYVILIAGLLLRDRKRDALNIGIIGITSTALLMGLKQYYGRTRPDLPLLESLKNFSFPSGHALTSFIFCSVLAYIVFESRLKRVSKWIIAIALLLFSVLIGLSRIILRMHYATDVIAGFCLGLAWVIISFWIMKKTEGKKETDNQ